ncbi:histidine phosphatase family protein [Chloroflexus sp.]|uniref:histidine phosphatase family protein n=1 Tax=Chloroflexus sp. TaxID=1904827 RepID=UPI002604DF73|nr:histidine phosphatase family protein [uncultured Chloroflexus sp.]
MLSDLFLIRHGQPVSNPAIPYQLPPGPDLSERGRAEARQVAIFLADKGVELLLVSPFARTTQTAEVLVDALGLPVTFTTLAQEHAPNESFEQVRARARELLAGLNDSPYQRVGIVTHGSPIRALLLELSHDQIDLSKHVYHGGNPAPTCGVWQVTFNHQRTCRFELVFKPSWQP